MSTPVAVIVLTFNEEENLPHALRSVRGWADELYVVDSFSTDRTVAIATEAGATVAQKKFEGYGRQRQFALDTLPIKNEWVLFLDADEWIDDDFKREVSAHIARSPIENAFLCRFRLMWMGKWVKRGYYGTWLTRLFRRSKARVDGREVNEHVHVDGPHGKLTSDIIHEDHKGLSAWIEKQNRYATMEAEALASGAGLGKASLFGTQAERKRWVRKSIWMRLPPLTRPWIYFVYRYFGQGAFLEGKESFSYHFLQALWLQSLIDLKYLEQKKKR